MENNQSKKKKKRQNKGKSFENEVKQAFERVEGVSIDRLRDAPKKLKGVDNPSDFIVYKKPHELYVECKSHKGGTLPFSCIREEQWNGLLAKSKIEGVKAGFVIWFIDHDKTFWVSIENATYFYRNGYRSIRLKDLNNYNSIEIHGTKKRVYFDYDMEEFLEELYGS